MGKLKKNKISLIGLLILVIIASGCATQNIDETTLEHSKLNFETKISESEVTIELTPKEFENGKLYVDIGVNTHSGNLADYDLNALTTLEFEGKSIKPSSAPKLSGHHNSGTLVFDIGKELDNFKIVVINLPEIQERIFEWT